MKGVNGVKGVKGVKRVNRGAGGDARATAGQEAGGTNYFLPGIGSQGLVVDPVEIDDAGIGV